MATFMAAYLSIWLAVLLYAGRIGLTQRRLRRELDALEEQAKRQPVDFHASTRAA